MHLAPTGREVVQALRGILLQAHWHTFTLLADRTSATALQRPELWGPLAVGPLHPTLIPLPNPLRAQQIFRKLADISRSTRGVVVLLSNRPTAVRILEDAKRLNMLDGHFVWIWIDTHTPFYHVNITEDLYLNDRDQFVEDSDNEEKPRNKREIVKSELSDMNVNYLLKNDQFLLFNHRDAAIERPTSPAKGRPQELPPDAKRRDKVEKEKPSELPLGLLSLRPMPIKVDRHLVKGAVRLLISALKVVLARGPDWLIESVALEKLSTSCWKPLGVKEFNFSDVFGR